MGVYAEYQDSRSFGIRDILCSLNDHPCLGFKVICEFICLLLLPEDGADDPDLIRDRREIGLIEAWWTLKHDDRNPEGFDRLDGLLHPLILHRVESAGTDTEDDQIRIKASKCLVVNSHT